MTDKFRGFDAVDIKTLRLVSLTSKRSVDIRQVVRNIAIYSTIFAPTTHGEIELYDGSGQVQNLPLIGEELLEIEFETPGREPFSRLFHVSKPESARFNENGTHYEVVLKFVSLDEFPAATANIQQGYKETIGEIARGVLQTWVGTKVDLDIEDTKGIEQLVIPGWNGWETMEFLRERAVSQKYFSPFVFFEDQQGYHFCSYEYLIEKRESKADELVFTSDPYLPESGEKSVNYNTVLSRQYRNVSNLEILEKADSIGMALNGGVHTRTIVFDMFEKNIRNVDVKHSEASSIVKKALGRKFNPTHSDDFLQAKNPTRRYMIPLDSFNAAAIAEQYSQKQLFTALLNETVIAFNTHGDSELQPGDVIKFQMPATVASEKPDEQLSGKYIIGSLRHGIVGNQMWTTVEAYRYGFEEKII